MGKFTDMVRNMVVGTSSFKKELEIAPGWMLRNDSKNRVVELRCEKCGILCERLLSNSDYKYCPNCGRKIV